MFLAGCQVRLRTTNIVSLLSPLSLPPLQHLPLPPPAPPAPAAFQPSGCESGAAGGRAWGRTAAAAGTRPPGERTRRRPPSSSASWNLLLTMSKRITMTDSSHSFFSLSGSTRSRYSFHILYFTWACTRSPHAICDDTFFAPAFTPPPPLRLFPPPPFCGGACLRTGQWALVGRRAAITWAGCVLSRRRSERKHRRRAEATSLGRRGLRREENGKEAPMTEGREKVRLSAVAQICGAELNLGEQRFKMRNKEHMCHFSPFFRFLLQMYYIVLTLPTFPPDPMCLVLFVARRQQRGAGHTRICATAPEEEEEASPVLILRFRLGAKRGKRGGAGFNKFLAVAKK